MTASYHFAPNYRIVGEFDGCAAIAELEREVGVYSATPEFVRANCGPIARSILGLVPGWYYERAEQLGLMPNCDVRVHRLYPGDYPAYPGWHCDGEFRETYFSQPDLDRIPVSYHLFATVSSHAAGVSNCEFLGRSHELHLSSPPTSDHTLWGHLDTSLAGSPAGWEAPDGNLVLFDARTPHRVRPARVRGWRLFFRMSMWHRPSLGAGGKLTRQEQVYKLTEGGGW